MTKSHGCGTNGSGAVRETLGSYKTAGSNRISSSPGPSRSKEYSSYDRKDGCIKSRSHRFEKLCNESSDDARENKLRDGFRAVRGFLEHAEKRIHKNDMVIMFECDMNNDSCIVFSDPLSLIEIDRVRQSSMAIVSNFRELLFDRVGDKSIFSSPEIKDAKDADAFLRGRAILMLSVFEHELGKDVDLQFDITELRSVMSEWERKILTVNDALDLRDFIEAIIAKPLDLLENDFVSNCKGDNIKSSLIGWKEFAKHELRVSGWVREGGRWKLPSKSKVAR